MKRALLLLVLASCVPPDPPSAQRYAYTETRPGPTYDDCRLVVEDGGFYAEECVNLYTAIDILHVPLEDGGYQEVQLGAPYKIDGGW